MSLYLKYRPQQFRDLVGQDHIRVTLQNAFKKQQVSHAYLFCGPRGTGKTSTARIIAKALNCPEFDHKELEPCKSCDICQAIAEGKLIDVVEIDAASNRGIDEIRELKETIKFAPTRVPNKVYIIDEVHMLTTEAFNALLKTLEEPPDNVYFILATTEVHKIPDTIISRCQRFDFRRLSEKTIEARLAFIAQSEKIELESGVLDMIARHVDGGLRDAIGLLEQLNIDDSVTLENAKSLIGSTGMDVIASFLDNLFDKKQSNALAVIQSLYDEGYDLGQFKKDFITHIRLKLYEAIESDNMAFQSDLVKMIEIWQSVMDNFSTTIIPQLPFEVFIVKVCKGQDKSTTVDVTEKPKKVAEKKVVEKEEEVVELEEPVPVDTEMPEDIESVPTEFEGVADLEEAWNKVLAKINKPTLKRSLQQGELRSQGDNVYEIVFNSDFHFNTVNSAENIGFAEELIQETTKLKVNLKPVIERIEIVTKKSEKKVITEVDVPPAADDLVSEAMELFEGEFVD